MNTCHLPFHHRLFAIPLKATYAAALAVVLFVCGSAAAIEIPLGTVRPAPEGAAAPEQSGAIAYVNVDKVFAEHPMTKRLKNEFLAEVEKRRKEIDDMQNAINEEQRVILSSATQVTQAKAQLQQLRSKTGAAASPTEPVTAPLPAPTTGTAESAVAPAADSADAAALVSAKESEIRDKEAGIELMKQNVDKMKQYMEARLQTSKQDLQALEEKNTDDVLADIYHLLEKVARDENVTLILNKDDILYGQSVKDLTPKVLERLQGR
jgi:Skp family chaperone for outer membrane proteins